jgi:uncharacterized membrane-anchored protein
VQLDFSDQTHTQFHTLRSDMMGGGPEAPAKHSSNEKELAIVTLPNIDEHVRKGIEGLEAEFKDVEVKFFNTKPANGEKPKDIPEGMYIPSSPGVGSLYYIAPTVWSLSNSICLR